jgi:hypothetical protein
MKIKFQKGGVIKEVKAGISWTTLFFGFFVAILRQQWIILAITYLSCGLSNFYFMFTINKLYAQKLILEGWTVQDQDKQQAFIRFGILP